MICNKSVMTLAGGLIIMLVSASCSSKTNTRTTDNKGPRDNAVASDRMASTELQVPSNRTGAGDNRVASDRVVPCADQRSDSTASPDCGPGNRLMASDRTAYDSSAGAISACPSRTDSRGNVIYDDPTCPTRSRQSQQQMGSSYQNLDVTRESAFFDRYIVKAVKHAREAETAGNQGHAPEMLRHAGLSLDQAKEAQRAGNVPGLNEGINSLREALRLAGTGEDRTGKDRTAYDSTTDSIAACTSRTDANGTVIYDDPTCPTRYRQSQSTSLHDAMGHVRDARISLSQAGGMRPTDTRIIARSERDK